MLSQQAQRVSPILLMLKRRNHSTIKAAFMCLKMALQFELAWMGDAFGEVARNPDEAAVMVAQQNENVRATCFAQVFERIFFVAVVFDFVNVELRFC